MGQMQEREAARQEREAIEQEALANAMDVEPAAVQQNVQNILNLFQHNYTLYGQRAMHFTPNQFTQYMTQNYNQANAQFNAGIDPRQILHQAIEDVRGRGDQLIPAAGEHMGLVAGHPKAKARVKMAARGQPKRRGRAITAGMPAALAIAAAPSGAGTLIPW